MAETVSEYIKRRGITVEVVEAKGEQTDLDDRKWRHFAYVVRMHLGDRVSPNFPWRQGIGDTTPPVNQPEAILSCVVDDGWGYVNARSFEEWASEYGYDDDSRKVERIYKACGETWDWLVVLLGGTEEAEHLATEVERY